MTPRCETPPPSLAALADNLSTVWSAATTDARLKKRIVRTVIHEVIVDIDAEAGEIVLIIHWMGGAHTQLRLPAPAAWSAQQHRARYYRRRPAACPHCQ
jgi:hypothetical protein